MIGKKINELATELAPVSTDLTIIGDPITGVSKKITIAQLGAIFSGAVSFYTNLAAFPAVGDINVIYCAKDTKKLYLWDGSTYVEVFPAQALLDTYQLRSEKGVSNGYASLDSGGKVPISQLPSSIMEYKGTWSAATNTPTLANGTGDTGDVYICNAAGTVNFGAGAITFAVGDYVIYSGSIWQRSSGAVGTVTSVAVSRSGDALAITGSPITTSGTINIGFAGTGAQYIKGDGTLATFPSIISQAQNLVSEVYNNTGATLTKGTVVYINGGQGNLPTVTKALATGDSTSAQTYGIVQNDITNNNNGYVVVAGRLSDIDTQAYLEGTQLYLSSTTAGTYTSTKQYAPAHLVYIGIIVRSHPTQGIIEVKIQNGYELDELHNVAAQTPTNNDGLFWEASTSLWKNKSIATILGYTPQAQLNGTGFVKASGTTITYDNSTYLTTSAAATTYLPLVLSSTTNVVDINGQQFNIYGSAGSYTSGRIIVDPVFSAIGYQNAGVFDGLKILTNGNAEFSNSGITRFFNQVRFDSTLTNGTYTYTLPSATGTIALTSDIPSLSGYVPTSRTLTINGTAFDLSANRSWSVGTVTSVGLSSATSGVTIGSTPVTTSGTITLAIATASGSQQGLLSSTDWTTFNNKQNALTNPVTGTGTTNYLPKFTGTSTIGNSGITDDGTTVTLISRALSGTSGAFSGILQSTGGDIRSSGTASDGVTSGPFISVRNSSNAYQYLLQLNASYGLDFWTFGGTWNKRMTIDASGNLGLGVTPSAWTVFKVMQIGSGFAAASSGTGNARIFSNTYYDGSYRYVANGTATMYEQDGYFAWYQAASGTAGNAISFTQAMTLNASGNLSIGNTNNTYKLDVTGEVYSFKNNGYSFILDRTATTNYNGISHRTGNSAKWFIGMRENGSNDYIAYSEVAAIDVFRLNNATGAATFSSDVTTNATYNITSGLKLWGNHITTEWYNGPDTVFVNYRGYNSGTTQFRSFAIYNGKNSQIALFDGSTGAATFSSSVTAGGYLANGSTTITSPIDTGSTKAYFDASSINGAALTLRSDSVGRTIRLISDGSGTTTAAIDCNTTGLGIGTNTNHPILFTPNATERMRITSGGDIGIGTTTINYASTNRRVMEINGTSEVMINLKTGDANKAYIYHNGTNLYTENSRSGGDWYLAQVGAGSMIFNTNGTERMRITSGGALLVNGTTQGDGALQVFFNDAGSTPLNYGARIVAGRTNSSVSIAFSNPNGIVGSIQTSGSATSYNTSSDYRLKQDLKDFKGLDLVSKIKTYDYEWKSDKSRSYGVIAHELQSVINYAVTGKKDGEQMQGVDYSKIVPVLIKAIQELNDKIK